MNLPIEDWIKEKKFKIIIQNLFHESILCYKIGAYRAALLFSYTSFLTIIKENILQSNKPVSIEQTRWDAIIRGLQNEDAWEERVLNEIFNNSSPIFSITENLRQQIKYWKDRRNDCAHFKENEIGAYHVESLWSFIKSNLSKITIDGGKESLLQKFKEHFDELYTPKGADFTPLVKEIDFAIKKSELNIFFDELIPNIDSLIGVYFTSNSIKVFNKIFEYCEDVTKQTLAEFIKKNGYDLYFLKQHIDKVAYLNYTMKEVRLLWRKRIIEHGFREETYIILAALLRNNLIPLTEISEALNYLFDKFNQADSDSFYYTDELHSALSANGFGNIVFQKAIMEQQLKKFMWVNSKADLIAYYIEYYPLNLETVKRICEMSSSAKPSQWLERELKDIFSEKPLKKLEFTKIATDNAIAVPSIYT